MERPLTHDFQEIANVMYTGTLTPAHTVQGTPGTPLNSWWRHNVASRYQSFQQVELPVSIRGSMQPGPIDVEELKAANQSFYEAFGALDIDRMEDVWETSERSLCVHPGWQPLVGWNLIKESWSGIFNNAMLMHFNVQYVNVVVEGDCGWVTCYEHISSVLQGRASNFGILATNIFVHTPSGWRMTAHHGTPRM